MKYEVLGLHFFWKTQVVSFLMLVTQQTKFCFSMTTKLDIFKTSVLFLFLSAFWLLILGQS